MSLTTYRPPAPPEFAPISEQSFRDPASMYDRARAETPIFWYETLGVWVATRREDVDAILTDWQLWNSGRTDDAVDAPPPRLVPDVAKGIIDPQLMTEMLPGMNPPKHTAARRAAQTAFLKPAMDALEPEIEARAHRIVDRFASDGQVELMNKYCLELTTQTMMALLDLPDDLRDFVDQLRDDHFAIVASGVEPMPEPRQSEVWGRYAQAHLQLREIIRERRGREGLDALTVMANGKDAHGDYVLSVERVALHACEFAAAGTDTTAQAMANAVLFLNDRPDQLREAIADDALWPEVFEETIRRRPSAPFAARVASEDIEVGGVTVPQGELVWIALASANTDPAVVERPMEFDIHRDDKTHYSFTKGRHTCIGAPLARVQGATGLKVLYNRLPSLRPVAGQVSEFLPMAMLPVRRSLAVEWDH
jgi:hypothetical protein